ncbi:MAG: hypothetical protein KJ799_08560 [Bacteroidetes bacterium]|nr:hypothetical protein [Bacteroidota bacterium]MBU1679596.1 hypothetical protein [Bacteroidota bacterium]MBU2506761.1 hypothetical protein [Bacteroidota bacterium]
MKKYISIIFITIFLSASSIFAQWVSFNGTTKAEKPRITVKSFDYSSMLLEISISGIESSKRIEENNTYDVIKFPGYNTTLEIGKPQLPAIRELLAIPDFTNYKFSIVDSSVITLTNYNVFPFQTPVPEGEKEEFSIDELFYKQDNFFPNNVFELDNRGIWRDIQVSTLSIFPIQYNPKTKTLRIFQKVVVKIDFEQVTGSAFVREKSISIEWEKTFKNSIINFDFLPEKLNKSNSLMSMGDYDYLIITDDDYLETIESFAQWKTRKGLLTKIIPISEIGNNQTYIKNYIIDEFNDHNIQYVLLVGDISEVAQACDPVYQYWGDIGILC